METETVTLISNSNIKNVQKNFKINKSCLFKEISFFSGFINFNDCDSIILDEDPKILRAIVFYLKNDLLINYRETYSKDFIILLNKRAEYYCLKGLIDLIDKEIKNIDNFIQVNLPLEFDEIHSNDFRSFILKSFGSSIQMNLIIEKKHEIDNIEQNEINDQGNLSNITYNLILECKGLKHCMLCFIIKLDNITIKLGNINKKFDNVVLWGGKKTIKLCSISSIDLKNKGELSISYYQKEFAV